MTIEEEIVKAEADNMQKLVGGRVGGAISDGKGMWGFRVHQIHAGDVVKILNVWVQRDPEGNGPGHLEIEEAV